MKNINDLRPAFSMIELVFIVVIVGILAGVALPKFAANRDNARMAMVKHDIEEAADAIYQYYLTNPMDERVDGSFRKKTIDEMLRFNSSRWSMSPDGFKLVSKFTGKGPNGKGRPCAEIEYQDRSYWDHNDEVRATIIGDRHTTPDGSACRALRRLFPADSNGGYNEDYVQVKELPTLLEEAL